MVVGPHETLQMGQLVPYCGPSHPDGKMSQKCQGKPSWLHSRYSSLIHHRTTPKKRPNSALKCCHRLHIGTVAIIQTLVQYFIRLFVKTITSRVMSIFIGQSCTFIGKNEAVLPKYLVINSDRDLLFAISPRL